MTHKITTIAIMEPVEMEVCLACGGAGVSEITEKKRSVTSLFSELRCLNYYLSSGRNATKAQFSRFGARPCLCL